MVAIPFSYDLGSARVALAAKSAGLIYTGSDGLQILSGLNYDLGLSATSFAIVSQGVV
jgi:hypothetical protein